MTNFWIEKTKVTGRKDRETGENSLGKALWSPQKDKRGGDIYSNMRKVKSGDIILHLVDNDSFLGVSKVLEIADASFIPPENTEWSNKPSYRIKLTGFLRLDPPLSRYDLLNEKNKQDLIKIARSNNVFYQGNLNLRQGAYLTAAPLELIKMINQSYYKKTGKPLPYFDTFLDNSLGSSEDIIAEAAKKVLKEAGKALGLNKIYNHIINEKLYNFGALDPVSALRVALDRRSLGVKRDDTPQEKWFMRYDNQIYELISENINKSERSFPKNLILYGPPGTGKTFITKRKAVEIIE